MQLHNLRSPNKKSGKRIGRGGRRGTYSGRGIKGQRSRSGHRIRPALRDLIIKIPKRRGFANKSIKDKPLAISLSRISLALKPMSGDKPVLDRNVLVGLELLPARRKGGVKILAGEIDFPITVKGIQISEGAKAAVEKAGGKVI